MSPILTMLTKLWLVILTVKCIFASSSLPSAFYQPGAGLVIESWRMATSYSFNQFNQIPDYPNCPHYIQNSDTFQYHALHTNQHIRARTFFVSPQSGNHKFFVICNNKCQINIEHLPNTWKTLLDKNSPSPDNWNSRAWASEVNVMKGFRYLLVLLFYGNGNNPDFFRLGVRFPDGTEVKPITQTYLRRSMEFYEWQGLLAQRYESINFPSSRTLANFKSLNSAKYPTNPSSYMCRSTLYDPQQYGNYGNHYALRYIGYFRPPVNGTYTFKMWCNEMCEFMLTKNNVETTLGSFVIVSYSNPSSVQMNGGYLTNLTIYPIKAFTTEEYGSDYIRVMHKTATGSYQSSWAGKIRNLLSVETYCNIPVPVLTALNSTAISVSLPTLPSIPPRDNWAHMPKYEIYYHKKDNAVPLYKFSFTGSLPVTAVATSLSKYTDYSFYAFYFGLINNVLEHHLISQRSEVKTDEDIPDAPPSNVRAVKQTSTSIKVSWGLLPSMSNWNGIALGYSIKYAIKDANPKTYNYVEVIGSGNRQKTITLLLKYTVYEFQVAGKTSKGIGVYSAVVEERTKEDVPSAAPVSLSAHNTSSRSISIQWNDVVPEHRNGIVTQYKVYYRKSPSDSPWSTATIVSSQKSYEATELDLWTFYDIKVSAFTSVGEGTQSSLIKVRTDEDKPTGPPQSLSTISASPVSINAAWTSVDPSKTNGIITGYKVTCQRTDKTDSLRTISTTNQTITLVGLDEYVDYDISVAGFTQKGVGPFTNVVQQRTLQRAPSAPPTEFKGNNISSSAIRVHWGLIPLADRNGIITNYNVSFRKSSTSDPWQSVSVNSTTFSFTAFGLDNYQLYDFKIAGLTVGGIGPFSNISIIRTDADSPRRPPANLTGHFIDHRSLIVTWSRVPEGFRQGVITGYKLMYKDGTKLNSTDWITFSIPNIPNENGLFNKTLTGLKIYTPYVFKIAGFTYKAVGVFSEQITVWTDEYTPFVPPRNTTGQNASSTELFLNWKNMGEVDGDANGKILGYKIRFQVVDCHEDRPVGCNEGHVFTVTTKDANPNINLTNLRKFTEYSISVKVFNSKGEGNYSKPIRVRTGEDKPDAPPTIVQTWPGKTESIRVFWSPIPESLRNGIITGYRIFYKPIVEPLRKYNRAPRSINPFAVYGALPGEKMLEVNASTYQVELMDLKDYSWYRVRIGALTSKGLGVTFSFNATCQQKGPIEAPELNVIDKYSFYEIALNWSEISNTSARGEVLGYNIHYWPIERNDVLIPEFTVKTVNVLAPKTSAVVKNLTPYTTYAISILGYTEGGFGIPSKYKPGETCRCPKVLYSARMIQPPIVDGYKTAIGILPKYVDEAIDSCCGNCVRGHGKSHIDWTNDIRNSSPVKYTMNSVLDSIASGTQVTVPFFMDSTDMTGSENSLYSYISFLPSPGVAIFRRKPSLRELGNKGAAIISGSIFKQYSLLLITMLFTILAGIIFWFLEYRTNTAEYSKRFTKGTGTGIWLAYITMTTVGYGDITPVTKLARLFTIFWSLLGIILTGMIVGGISDVLSSEILHSSVSLGVQGKVLVSNETFMLAIKELKAKVVIGNTSDPYFMRNALLSEDVARVVLDAYKAVQFRDILEHPDIEFESLKKMDASYGVALSGEGSRIKHCVARYAQENSQRILSELSSYHLNFKAPAAGNLELLDHMLSEHADITRLTIKFGGIILAALVVIGAIFDLVRWARRRAKVQDNANKHEQVFQEVSQGIGDMMESFQQNIEKIEHRHAEERLKLLEMDKNYHVTRLYPNLSIFDPTIPYKKGIERSNSSKEARSPTGSENSYFRQPNNDENEGYDMPIDYKSSWPNLR